LLRHLGARSPIPALARVVNSGVRTLIWTGDADWICNYLGALQSAEEVRYPGQAKFKSAKLQPYTVNGTSKGLYKQVENFSFMRVYESGHQLPYYQRELALQVFIQMMQTGTLKST
jgi:carboxypeptidase C (cathepsin A)